MALQLALMYGKGWSEQQLRHCLRAAETFPDEAIFSALRRELTWTHIKPLMYMDDSLKREFYTEMTRLEGWSGRLMQGRIQSMLFERTAISRKPEDTIQRNIAALREQGTLSPDLAFRDLGGWGMIATEFIAVCARSTGARGRFHSKPRGSVK